MISLLGIRLVETLRAHFEFQVFHRFIDKVRPLERCQFQIAEGVVSLLIVHVNQTCYLWEAVGDVPKQALCALLVAFFVIVKLHQKHELFGIGIAHH